MPINQDGYIRVSLTKDKARKKVFLHVLVASAFLGAKPDGCEINHKDGNKENNAADNLEY
ncbi:HNH endonuclease signature motif containing protein, partial [Listeria monocytogenes]|uniref:HNH endonuclease signature motif containing protein n=1 Tax=Listeria monocytogenes TaxID=1639 RepID=UPI003C6DA65C